MAALPIYDKWEKMSMADLKPMLASKWKDQHLTDMGSSAHDKSGALAVLVERVALRRISIENALRLRPDLACCEIQRVLEPSGYMKTSARHIQVIEALETLLHRVNFDRAAYGYMQHHRYVSHLETMVKNWTPELHIRLMETVDALNQQNLDAKQLALDALEAEKRRQLRLHAVSDAPDSLDADLEVALLGEAERRLAGIW